MTYQPNNTVEAADFNSLLFRVNRLYGVGVGDYGYGQSAIVQTDVSAQSTIGSTEWTKLVQMLTRCSDHQGQFTGTAPVVADVAVGSTIAAFSGTTPALTAMLSNAELYRTTAAVGSMTLTSQAHSAAAGTWTDIVSVKVDVQFPSEDAARFFFNSGGQIRLRLNHPNGSMPKDNDIRAMIAKIGTVQFAASQTFSTGTAARGSTLGFYDLVDTYQTIYDGSDLGGGLYATSDMSIIARRLNHVGVNGGNGTGIRFQIAFVNDQNDDVIATGMNVAFDVLRATTHLTGISSPTFSTFLAWSNATPSQPGDTDTTTPPPSAVSEVFSVNLYSGDDTTRTITTGTNLSGSGGLVWVRNRTSGHTRIWDVARGPLANLSTAGSAIETSSANSLTAFTTAGFTVGNALITNQVGNDYAAWSFRDAPGFFDVVLYTGNGTTQTVNHSLGGNPGMVVIKRRDTTVTSWAVWHRSLTGANHLFFDGAAPQDTSTGVYGNNTTAVAPTSLAFTVGNSPLVNASGGSYVAYIFGHSPSGFIQAGSYLGNGNLAGAGPTVTLGWQPQWLMVKNTTTGNWRIWDAARSPANPRDITSVGNLVQADSNASDNRVDFTSTGFTIKSTTDTDTNANGATYIYLAVRAP